MLVCSSHLGMMAQAGGDFLDVVLASTCCDLDATIAASYTSGQTWANLIASPNDGAAQADYDFYLGADGSSTATDPTFTGTAGNAAAYFALDDGDYFTLIDGSGAPNAVTLRDLHKTATSKWWIALSFQTETTLANSDLWGGSNANGDDGIEIVRTGTGADIRLRQADGSARSSVTLGTSLLSALTNYLLIVSADMTASSNNVRMWLNSTTKTEFSKTWNSASGNADGVYRIAATDSQGSVTAIVPSGARIYHWSLGNSFIDDSDAASIFSHLEARHSRDYTP